VAGSAQTVGIAGGPAQNFTVHGFAGDAGPMAGRYGPMREFAVIAVVAGSQDAGIGTFLTEAAVDVARDDASLIQLDHLELRQAQV